MKTKISYISRIYKPSEVYEIEFKEVLYAIKSGSFKGTDLRYITSRIASWNDHDKQNELKYWNLPVVLYNGVFDYKNNDKLKEYSNLTAMDFDNFSSEQELNRHGYWLTQTPCVACVFRTPSGKGLKAIVLHDNTDPRYHEELYSNLLSVFKIPTTDTSVSDVSRGNYLCYDPNVWINDKCIAYHFQHNPNFIPTVKSRSVSRAATNSDIKMLEFMLSLKKPVGKKSDKSIINILNSCWKRQPERWKSGNRANSVFRSASEFCNAGVEMKAAIDYLLENYRQVGLQDDEIIYQAQRGYQCNAENYGKTRTQFDSYGSKNRTKR